MLQTTSIERFGQTDKGWSDLGQESVSVEENTYTVTLPPGRALLVEHSINYTGHDSESFDIVHLTLSQGDKVVEYDGKSAQTAFKKEKGADYAVRFTTSS